MDKDAILKFPRNQRAEIIHSVVTQMMKTMKRNGDMTNFVAEMEVQSLIKPKDYPWLERVFLELEPKRNDAIWSFVRFGKSIANGTIDDVETAQSEVSALIEELERQFSVSDPEDDKEEENNE